jgi:hypothetical protein
MDTSIVEARDAAAPGSLARIVLDYSLAFQHLMNRMKAPDYSDADWKPITDIIATDVFKRIGAFKEEMDFATYKGFIVQWGGGALWDGSFKRITEVPGLVFLELEERTVTEGHHDTINSVTVYRFNDAKQLVHLDVYLQRAI